jgi:outer membrane usher protein
VTTPLLSASGEAIVPSTVDVFVNGQPVASEQVQPGPFQIDGVPALNGAGQMQVVVTDALGRQQVLSQPYYSGRSLLRQGLSEYSLEAGKVRRNYARRSNDYGNVVGAATYRHGITDQLTAEAHAEAEASGAAATGIDTALQVGTLGIVTATAAASGDGNGRGWLAGGGFEHNGPRFSLFARSLYASENFTQLGDDALLDRPRSRSFGGLGFNLLGFGNLQLAYGRQTHWTTPSVATIGLGYSLGLGAFGFLNLFASYSDSTDTRKDLFLTWTMPLGDRRSVSASLRKDLVRGETGSDFEAVATVQQNLPVGTGSGYVATVSSENQYNFGYAYQGQAGTAAVDYARSGGQDGVRVGGTGGVAITGVGAMPSRRIDQSFAMVQVADYPGIEVFVDNQPVGRTDEKGRVMLDNLLPYQANEVSVDPAALPMDATISTRSIAVTPAYRSGMAVQFPVSRADALTLRLLQADRTPVPAGAEVTVDGSGFPVGLNGLVYLSGILRKSVAEANWRDGRCSFVVERPAGSDPVPDVGDVTCQAPVSKR